ncbi:acetoacetate--CoA ligase [Oceanimonas doudoroffii]|uniref:Acetoacetate--CoA ligase n=1 Tax=Oceanimonas doudoroffii TaxID=84158 RepID=A0A233RHS8_9GAMM|nr:acetoacetate--CoA ligase [Oceanimonas doudoroffii]OXY82934.1 acetoacetate--CoA ligase [Oceanimonas doudoroffii]
MQQHQVLWTPTSFQREHSQMTRYIGWLESRGLGSFADYAGLHAWSVTEPEAFWQSVWDFCELHCDTPAERVLGRRDMPGAEWFPGMRMNFAGNLLRHGRGPLADHDAVVCHGEAGKAVRYSFARLFRDVGALEAWLRARGVQCGDRVAGVVTHGYEALVAMLAATSMGAVWSSASPDFGADAIIDRFGQISPSVLVLANGYRYGGRDYDRREEFARVVQGLPGLRAVLDIPVLPGLGEQTGPAVTCWSRALAEGRGHEPSFTPLPADHPVYILFSSGTTGRPKCIVHGAAGILVNHAKELVLHGDMGPGDRLMYYTTCGWMMWNWQASALQAGVTLITVDGAVSHPDLNRLWALAEQEKVTHFGTSARFLAECRKAGLQPGQRFALDSLRLLFSTGSPLLPEDYDWVYGTLPEQVLLGSVAGGTDICGCFVGCCPLLPVRRGEIQCRFLGVDAVAVDEQGRETAGRGELVCRQPLPSMPVGFWQDDDGQRYRAAYFDTFPGVWAHGDYVAFTEQGGAIIYGRSDATLNPGGVRIGTAEIYRQVELDPNIRDSLVVGRRIDGDVEVVLLVVANGELSQDQCSLLRQRIRTGASPRHMPRHILQVPEIPYTRSGKKVELAVARLLNGEGRSDNKDALANPQALDAIAGCLQKAGLLKP